jgi:hypothetical protein
VPQQAGRSVAGLAQGRSAARVRRRRRLQRALEPVPDDVDAYWRDDGAAVAIVAGYAPAKDPPPGYGPPRYLLVLPLDGSPANAAAPLSGRQRAQALNVDGLKLLAGKSLAAAQQRFHDAVDQDDSFALAYSIWLVRLR